MSKNKGRKKGKYKNGELIKNQPKWTTMDHEEVKSLNQETFRVINLNHGDATLATFTIKSQLVHLYFCEYSSLRGYVQCNKCNGQCYLCMVGKNTTQKYLYPVYSIEWG